MKLAFFDIESSALRTRAWSLYDERAIKYDEDWKLLCFAWKEPGKPPQFERRHGGEKTLVKKLHKVLSSYDILVAHNGKKFDIKKANAKFLEYGLRPITSYQVIDTLTEARKWFNLTSFRLNDLARLLGLPGKTKHEGFETWEGCERDDPEAWKLMEKYNKQDVILLEQVYERLEEWIKQVRPVWKGKLCECGSKLQKRGEVKKDSKTFQRYYCLDCKANVYGPQVIERI